MQRRMCLLLLAAMVFLSWPNYSPAPIIFRRGEGWSYESIGGVGSWRRGNAKDQLGVAKKALAEEDWKTAFKAARRTVAAWPLSDHAPEAQLILAQSYEQRGDDQKAFEAYQDLLRLYPHNANFEDVQTRQIAIATRYLNGQRFKLWRYIPVYKSMRKTAGMFQDIVSSGPFSSVAPKAHKYHDRPDVASEGLFAAAAAYQQQSLDAEYDQGVTLRSIDSYSDFIALYPKNAQVPQAKEQIRVMKVEQARGNLKVARYYEKRGEWAGANVYYNEVKDLAPGTEYAEIALQKIADLKPRFDAEKAPEAQPQ